MSDEMTQKIIGAAMEVHTVLGPGLLESIYESALCREFALRDITFKRQVPLTITYKGEQVSDLRIDLLVEETVIVEVKSLTKLPDVATAQLLSYLKATGLSRGLILNFGTPHLRDGIKRISL